MLPDMDSTVFPKKQKSFLPGRDPSSALSLPQFLKLAEYLQQGHHVTDELDRVYTELGTLRAQQVL